MPQSINENLKKTTLGTYKAGYKNRKKKLFLKAAFSKLYMKKHYWVHVTHAIRITKI